MLQMCVCIIGNTQATVNSLKDELASKSNEVKAADKKWL